MLQQEQLLNVERPCPDPDPKVAAETSPTPNTYQIRPSLEQTFMSEKIKKLINTILSDTLTGQSYTAVDAARWTKTLADEVSLKVKDLEMKRYKHVVQVVLGQQLGAGCKYIARCRWDAECDNQVSAEFKNATIFCIVTVFGRLIGEKHPVFIIAEIGQNHQGSIEIAKQMILKAKELGVDCVKFQKSCLQAKFTNKALEREYIGPNSWGSTYGEHKAYLEFSMDEFYILQNFCSEIGILFTASAMDSTSFLQLIQMKVPFIKIGSGDADNLPLLRQAALSKDIPLVVATGMQSWHQVQQMYSILCKSSTALLHCISAYPTPPDEACLNLIPLYKDHFPEFIIGYSGHELGLQITVASVLLGARIIERHFTLDKGWKGTDHRASLNPDEFGRLIKYIRAVENVNCSPADVPEVLSKILPETDFNREELFRALKPVTRSDRRLMTSEIACHTKLGKSLVFGRDIEAGDVLAPADVVVKVSEPSGLSPTLVDEVVGRVVRHSCRMDEPILSEDLVPIQ